MKHWRIKLGVICLRVGFWLIGHRNVRLHTTYKNSGEIK